jgi:hypothetical protein
MAKVRGVAMPNAIIPMGIRLWAATERKSFELSNLVNTSTIGNVIAVYLR